MDTEAKAISVLAASEDPYYRVLAQLAYLHSEKAADYDRGGVKNEDYFPFGDTSYAQMVWVKALRLRSLLSAKGTIQNESVLDMFLDFANYAIFALMRTVKK